MWLYIRELEEDECKRKVQRCVYGNRLSFSELFDDILLMLTVRRLCVVVDSLISAAKVCDCVISAWCWQVCDRVVELRFSQCKTQTADCRLQTRGKMQTVCKMQTESKTQDGVKCRLSINCSRGLVERFNKGKKDPANTCNRTLTCLLDDISFHKSIPFFSGTSSTTQKHNRNLEPFLNLTLQL